MIVAQSLAAAICRQIAWLDTLMAGTAILSLSVKSASVLMPGVGHQHERIDCTADSARISFWVPAALSHSTLRPGTPVTPKSICRLSSAVDQRLGAAERPVIRLQRETELAGLLLHQLQVSITIIGR